MADVSTVVSALDVALPIESPTFTHTSLHGALRQEFEAPVDEPIYDYERIEEMRKVLVRNETLALLAGHFELQDHLLGSAAQLQGLRANPVIRAALFEAYLYTLHQSQGSATVETFVRDVFTPIAEAEYATRSGNRELASLVSSPRYLRKGITHDPSPIPSFHALVVPKLPLLFNGSSSAGPSASPATGPPAVPDIKSPIEASSESTLVDNDDTVRAREWH
ncbi:hypothetical protein P7C70_g4648, partial [Phenoliferia sp. Uapishka_3]